MKRLALGLLAASLAVAGVAADAQAQSPSFKAKSTYMWPKDTQGRPIPNAQNQCPSPYQYRQVTIMVRGVNGVSFPHTTRWCEFVYNY
jgi:hypothetical protein